MTVPIHAITDGTAGRVHAYLLEIDGPFALFESVTHVATRVPSTTSTRSSR